jgi:outer membrane receptor protein involved in Fe transport
MRIATCVLALSLVLSVPAMAATPGSWKGARLSDYLAWLNDNELTIVYSSDIVSDELTLPEEPDPDNPLRSLQGILNTLGLELLDGPAGSVLVVRSAKDVDRSDAGQGARDAALPEIVVTSSLHRLEYTETGSHTYLDRELATRIPAAAEEATRIANRLPGTASGGISSRTHVRGGEANEVLFLFDGLRLYEPYHLKDFQSVASIVNANAIGGMDYYSGAYPARYGDRMSGVMNVEMRAPARDRETELALSFFNTSLLSMGRFGSQGRGDWLLAARRGNLDLIADVIDPEMGSPDYQDHLLHAGWEFGPRTKFGANFLLSRDKLQLNEVERGESAVARYDNQVFWAQWQASWSDTVESETTVAASDITNRRVGTLELPQIVTAALDEYREFRSLEVRQDWRLTPSGNWMFVFGAVIRDLDAKYRFDSRKAVAPPFDTILDNEPLVTRSYDLSAGGAQHAVYGEARRRISDTLFLDFGMRWDQQNYTTAADDRQYSPRASLLYRLRPGSEFRLGWGQYYQSQEVNELQLADGIDEFFPAQRAEHFVASFRHLFDNDIELVLSAYRKSFRTLRPRFENVFNALTLLPEIQFDRVRIDAINAESVGAELMLSRGGAEQDMLWWFGYTWSEVVDNTSEGKFKRSWDQTHSVKAGLSWRWGNWDVSAAGEAHTGWPRTSIDTSRNFYRYSVFHTLDARISREFKLRRGELTAFLEVTNLYDRDNPCCTEYSVQLDATGASELVAREAHWLPIVPSLGVVWRF